jgi:hypothetical protein
LRQIREDRLMQLRADDEGRLRKDMAAQPVAVRSDEALSGRARPQIVNSDPSSNSLMGRCCRRKIPRLFILESNVVRLSPSLAAAPWGPPISPPAARNVCKIRATSCSRNVPCGATRVIDVLCDGGRGLGSTPSSDRMTARSIRFWSSRTLPGQGYAMNAFIVVSGICSMRFPMRLENTSTKCSTN